MLVAMLLLLSPVRCLKSFEVGNPCLKSLYLVWTSAVRVDLCIRQTSRGVDPLNFAPEWAGSSAFFLRPFWEM